MLFFIILFNNDHEIKISLAIMKWYPRWRCLKRTIAVALFLYPTGGTILFFYSRIPSRRISQRWLRYLQERELIRGPRQAAGCLHARGSQWCIRVSDSRLPCRPPTPRTRSFFSFAGQDVETNILNVLKVSVIAKFIFAINLVKCCKRENILVLKCCHLYVYWC